MKRVERITTTIYLSASAVIGALGIATTLVGLVLLATGAPN